METNTDQTPLLSITVLNYNYGHFLPVCLDSILSQTFTDFELILINDKSTDNSLEVINPYLSDPRIRFVDHEMNKGFVASLIEGAELSRGKYITVISADDWVLDQDTVKKQIAVLEQDDEIAFVYSAYAFCDGGGNQMYTMRHNTPHYVRAGMEEFQDLVLRNDVSHSGTIIRRTAYVGVGGYDENFRHAVDHKLWLELCRVGKVAYLDVIGYGYRQHTGSMERHPSYMRKRLEEALGAIHDSFSKLSPEQRRQVEKLETPAMRKALAGFVGKAAFGVSYKAGWRSYCIALQVSPIHTLFQPGMLGIALRIVLGHGRFNRLLNLKEKLHHRSLGSTIDSPSLAAPHESR